jgi:hypothetical protein
MKPKLGFCGDECSACPRYLATQADDDHELQRVASLWYAVGFRDRLVTTAEIRCTGCSPDRDCAHGIAACAGAREVEHCGRCADYPCDSISRCFEKTERMASLLPPRCSPADYEQLAAAFLRKRENLESGRRAEVIRQAPSR